MDDSGEGGTEPSKNESPKRVLQILFEIELAEDCGCPLSNPESQVHGIHNQIDDDTCHAEMTVSDETDSGYVTHTTNHVDDSCLCLAFSEVDCIPRIQSADGDTVVVETFVSDRELISELVDRLKSVTEQVSLKRLTAREQHSPRNSDSTTVSLAHLTSKQREAAMVAVSEGYYESPRQASLDDLTATLGISKSALSKRLTAVEAKLTTAVFDPD